VERREQQEVEQLVPVEEVREQQALRAEHLKEVQEFLREKKEYQMAGEECFREVEQLALGIKPDYRKHWKEPKLGPRFLVKNLYCDSFS